MHLTSVITSWTWESGQQVVVTFLRRDVVFDRCWTQPWFIELIGITRSP